MPSLAHHSNADQTTIDRDYRVVGWWGMALATFGLVVLLVSMATLLLD